MNDLILYPHQKKALNFVINKKKCALFLEMGLGKTIICLSAIHIFLKNKYVNKILIVAPLKVANTVWKQESQKWKQFNNIFPQICTGPLKKRLNLLNQNFNLLIINNEILSWLIKNYKFDFDMLIIDESSTFKNHQSKKFKILKKNLNSFKSIILLSGTPCPNSYLDLWSQIFLIDNGKRLGKNITSYKNKFFEKKDFMGYIWELKKSSKNIIKNLLSDICITMKINDHIKLPKKKYINYYCQFDKKTQTIYKKMEKDFFIQLNENYVNAVSTAVCINKLLQICNGSVYDENKNTIFIHQNKIILLKKIIHKYPNKNFFIAYNFKSDLILLKNHFPQAVILSPDAKELTQWNQGYIKILLAHPSSACYGLNAFKGGHIIIWYGLNWSLQNYLQFNSRLHRLGQKYDVLIINLLVKGSLDEKIITCLKNKFKNQNQLLEKLKKMR